MQLNIDGQIIDLDQEGFLKNLEDWQSKIAILIARNEQIELTNAHWEIINLTRDFYITFQVSPSMRALIKYIEKKLGTEKGKSIYLLKLFPNSPAKLACKIAGLPKPTNCM